MHKINTGDNIPLFTLKNQHGEEINISDFIGKKLNALKNKGK